jgi:hypothetical protein
MLLYLLVVAAILFVPVALKVGFGWALLIAPLALILTILLHGVGIGIAIMLIALILFIQAKRAAY